MLLPLPLVRGQRTVSWQKIAFRAEHGATIRRMQKRKLALLITLILTLSLIQFRTVSVLHAQTQPQFTVTIGGAYLRQQPALSASVGATVFAGGQYTVSARTANKLWLKLESDKGSGWLLSFYGKLVGNIDALPIAAAPPMTKAAISTPSKYISPITAKARKFYQAKAANKNPNIFTVIGDCNSVPEAYLGRLGTGLFDVSRYPALTPSVERFATSFWRTSVASFSGFNSDSMFNPEWANPQYCMAGEGPLACELRRSQASIVVIALGTGDQFTWKDFEKNYRGIIDDLLKRKVLPVLVTKADDLDSQQGGAAPGFINDTIRRLGAEYGMPVIDFWAATRRLPNFGMRMEGNENFHMSAEGSDTRILLTLQVLDALGKK